MNEEKKLSPFEQAALIRKQRAEKNTEKSDAVTNNRRRFNKIKQLANAIWLSCPDTQRLLASDPRDSEAANELDHDASVSVVFERFSDPDDATFDQLLAMRELADAASVTVMEDMRVRYTFIVLDCR